METGNIPTVAVSEPTAETATTRPLVEAEQRRTSVSHVEAPMAEYAKQSVKERSFSNGSLKNRRPTLLSHLRLSLSPTQTEQRQTQKAVSKRQSQSTVMTDQKSRNGRKRG
ncbi:hypothetical protein M9H77_06891 [Catharanthus roseus]|uniref:Uncharacterized protein n=1 Tax=Catharanthus roseus TaxID=4058 RepID=A0ACC0BTL8_CATRO|nr:hypothetical protein M9H77_06891 [Catharanthus roseus]